jgi:hypothetical protein
MFANYDNIVFGGVGTGLFYAAFMNKNITMLHKYLSTSYLDMDFEWGNKFENNVDEMRYVTYIATEVGCNFEDIDYNNEEFRKLADIELGVSAMLPPQELKQLLLPHLANVANPQSLNVYQENVKEFDKLLARYSNDIANAK